jgi:hypothetical protein
VPRHSYAMNHRSIQNGTPLDRRHTNIALEARRLGYEPMLFGYTDTTADPRSRDRNDPDLLSYGGVLPGFREGIRYQNEVFASWLEDLASRSYPITHDSHAMMVPPQSGDFQWVDSAPYSSRCHSIALGSDSDKGSDPE